MASLKDLLEVPGQRRGVVFSKSFTTRSKDATRGSCLTTRNKKLLAAPGIANY